MAIPGCWAYERETPGLTAFVPDLQPFFGNNDPLAFRKHAIFLRVDLQTTPAQGSGRDTVQGN